MHAQSKRTLNKSATSTMTERVARFGKKTLSLVSGRKGDGVQIPFCGTGTRGSTKLAMFWLQWSSSGWIRPGEGSSTWHKGKGCASCPVPKTGRTGANGRNPIVTSLLCSTCARRKRNSAVTNFEARPCLLLVAMPFVTSI